MPGFRGSEKRWLASVATFLWGPVLRLPPKHCLLHVQAIIWTRLAGVCPPDKMHWHPKPVFKADGTRVFGAGQYSGTWFAELVQSCPPRGVPAVFNFSWDPAPAGSKFSRASLNPLLLQCGNCDANDSMHHVRVVCYITELVKPDSVSKTRWQELLIDARQQTIAIVLDSLRTHARFGFKVRLQGVDRLCYARLGWIALDTKEREFFFHHARTRACDRCRLRTGCSSFRAGATVGNADAIHELVVEHEACERTADKDLVAATLSRRWGKKPFRHCLAPAGLLGRDGPPPGFIVPGEGQAAVLGHLKFAKVDVLHYLHNFCEYAMGAMDLAIKYSRGARRKFDDNIANMTRCVLLSTRVPTTYDPSIGLGLGIWFRGCRLSGRCVVAFGTVSVGFRDGVLRRSGRYASAFGTSCVACRDAAYC